MKKPCNNCNVNLEQAIFQDEVTCFKTCKEWKEWSKRFIGDIRK